MYYYLVVFSGKDFVIIKQLPKPTVSEVIKKPYRKCAAIIKADSVANAKEIAARYAAGN